MKLLFVFPHPDDESFGPAPAIAALRRAGHEVHLLTLTKGGATKVRHEMGLSVEEMGEIRHKEMLAVEKVLDLSSMTVLDLPDSGLYEMDPREIEQVLRLQIERLRPQILVTYPVHGISGFPDHLVMHAVAKRLYLEMRDEGADYLKRLAFFTLKPDKASEEGSIKVKASKMEDIDCIMTVSDDDMQAFHEALDCYETYQKTIAASKVREAVTKEVCFEIFGEEHSPPLEDLCSFPS